MKLWSMYVNAQIDAWAEDEYFKGICIGVIFKDMKVDSFLQRW